ncbi:1-propanol dehydrogenase PduQ [Arachnia propionica]|uniref:Iron-containing alcohol dehydrogenase n=1 Tax=Arachnia propionica TaxID=1750 RepID=A0A3P1WYR9_9ACTN|nr:1-propanol dehydrogenase PduQ [Arachnia propionica]RRD51335.1 iron-containing alcohol dehydrogenase [Arachnia propionica]
MKEFRLSTLVRLGPEALTALTRYRGESVFMVTDEFLTTTPVFKEALGHLGDRVTLFTGVLPNPGTHEIGLGVAEYLRAKPHVVVAYGGGSVMDAAKVMHKAALDAGFGAPEGIVAIPTTSGSGSEVTSFAVVTDEETHVKIPIVSADMVARLAILDPRAVMGAPAHITADSGMDTLTHAVEAYVARTACDFSDALAEKAVELTVRYLPRCHSHGDDLEAREHMHNASCMAAMAFDNVGLGITHSLAHALGGHYPIAHGRLNAMLLPHVIEFNAERSQHAFDRYVRLGRLVSPSATGRAAITSLISTVRRLQEQLGMPSRLGEAGVARQDLFQDIPELVAAALADGCTPPNPVAVTADDLTGILRRVA